MKSKVRNVITLAVLFISVIIIGLIGSKVTSACVPESEKISEVPMDSANTVITIKKDDYIPLGHSIVVHVDDYSCVNSNALKNGKNSESCGLYLNTGKAHTLQVYIDGCKSSTLKFNATDETQHITVEYYDKQPIITIH